MPTIITASNSTVTSNTSFTGANNTFAFRPLFAGNVPWDSGNFNPSNYAALSGATFSGAVSANALITPIISISGNSSYINILDRANTAAPAWAIYNNVQTLRFYVGVSDKILFDATGNIKANTVTVGTTTISGPSGTLNVGSNNVGNFGLELGPVGSGSSGSTYIDFHSGGGSVDYDARIIAAGGNTTNYGYASLSYFAASHSFSTRPTFNGATPWDSANFTPSNYVNYKVMNGGLGYETLNANNLLTVPEYRFVNTPGSTNFPANASDKQGYYFGFGGGDGGARGAQMFMATNNVDQNLYFRTNAGSGANNNSWSPWRQVVTDSTSGVPVTIAIPQTGTGIPLTLKRDDTQLILSGNSNTANQWGLTSFGDGVLYFQTWANGAFTDNKMWLSRNGNMNITGSFVAGININAAGNIQAPTYTVIGSSGQIAYQERSNNNISWITYANSGAFRVYHGPTAVDKFSIDGNGNGFVSNNLTVGGGMLYITGSGAQIGTSTSTGLLMDGTSVGLRGYGNNALYFQSGSGTSTYGTWGVGGLSVQTGLYMGVNQNIYLNGGSLVTDYAGNGGLRFINGGAGNSGYIEFRSANTAAPRLGYIGFGYAGSGGYININGEQAAFAFNGYTPSFNVGLNVYGGNVYYQSTTMSGTEIRNGVTDFRGNLSANGTTGVIGNANGGAARLEVRSIDAGNAAYIQFHKPGDYAYYFGMDVDRQLKVGGWSMGANAYPIWHAGNVGAPVIGQCRLVYTNTSTVTLVPYAGNRVFVNGVYLTLPNAGVSTTWSTNGSVAGLWYVGLSNNNGSPYLYLTQNTPSTNSVWGHQVVDTYNTLVGMVYVDGGYTADTPQYRYVASYFNRRRRPMQLGNGTASLNARGWTELNTAIRLYFVAWGDESVDITGIGQIGMATYDNVYFAVHVDGANYAAYAIATQSQNQNPPVAASTRVSVGTGFHYAGCMGFSGGSTASYNVGLTGIVII